ncbi:MAG TPA: hypothetical protein VK815_02330 [Candidatus Acidoferrales bacterium]|jgi:hypothetical protein|nr:hypothetical protein [Candidatus Acidoferrales bacterium]
MTPLRTESFVPLTAAPAPAGRREFNVSVIRRDDQPKPFHSLEPLRADALATTASTEKKICEPRVSVQRDNGRVTHLRIQCTCGQVMDLACSYDDSTATAA